MEIRGEKRKIHAADFDLSRQESSQLFENGRRAAEEFLRSWDFAEWKRRYGEKKGEAVMQSGE